MGNISWESWAQRAAAHIRFRPDRAGAEAELLAHMEDRAEALEAAGAPPREAQRKALAAMGDADQVGRQLAAVHRPWLGYLWQWSRRVLLVCLAVMVWMGCGFFGRVRVGEAAGDSFWNFADNPGQPGAQSLLTPACRDESDGYAFTVPCALVDEAGGSVTLRLILRAVCRFPAAESCAAFRFFYAVDDLGNVYGDGWHSGGGETPVLAGNGSAAGPWSSEYDCWISGLDPEAGWVELRYDRDGRDVRLRIDLTGGEEG